MRRGGDWDRWDLEVAGGALGGARLIVAIEDHGAGNQLVRARWWPSVSPSGLSMIVAFGALSFAAGLDHATVAAATLGMVATLLLVRTGRQCGVAVGALERSIGYLERAPQ